MLKRILIAAATTAVILAGLYLYATTHAAIYGQWDDEWEEI